MEVQGTVKTRNVGALSSGCVRPRQGTEICNFGEPSPLDFLNFLQWIFFLFSRFTV